jgi:hypothetical protein
MLMPPAPDYMPAHGDIMIKFMQCIRRKPHLLTADFRRDWDRYKETWLELARLSGAKRMTMSVGLDIDQNVSIQLARRTDEPFDGVLEVWWESGAHVEKMMGNQAIIDKLSAMRDAQEMFADLKRSSFFFASEEEYLGGKH